MELAMTPTLLSRLQLALAVSALTSITSAQTQPFYTVEFLGVATAATGLNDSGLAIGWTSSAGANLRGWVAGNGSGVTLLPLPPGRASSMVYGINDAGVIVGHVATGSSPEFSGVAAVWTPIVGGGYSVQELGTLPGSAVSRAVAINNGNDIVGFSVAGIFHRPVRFVAPGVVQDLSATGIADPKSINDQRVLVDATGKRLDLNTMLVQNLGVPTGLPSSYVAVYPNAINAPNQVVGAAVLATSGNCSRQAARYTDGIGWEILSGCGQYNDAHGINDAGDVVMRIGTAPYVRFQGWSTRRVEDLIANTVGHWVPYNTFYSLEINNTGQVVLPASNATTGQSGMVLLTPRPAGYASFGTGCLGPSRCQPSALRDDGAVAFATRPWRPRRRCGGAGYAESPCAVTPRPSTRSSSSGRQGCRNGRSPAWPPVRTSCCGTAARSRHP